MGHRFASLTLIAVVAATAAGQESGERVQGSGVRGQNKAGSGQELVAEAAKRVSRETAIAAELRFRIDAFGHELIGTGRYLQLGGGPEKKLKLELRMQVGERPATLLEIRGDDYYWMRREVPPARSTVEQVDLRQVRNSLRTAADHSPDDVLPHGGWIVLGGLPRLLDALERNFDFGAPRTDELQFSAAGPSATSTLPVWIVTGRWKPERLAAILGRERARTAELPEQLPDRVELVLRRTDDVLPLFPYKITYWCTPQSDGSSTRGDALPAPRELLSLEVTRYDVFRPSDIDPREFLFNPSGQEVRNVTTSYIQRLSGEKKLR